MELVWYASYGSNMSSQRFDCYIAGGTLPGMTRTYTGARDTRPPRGSRATWLSGQVYFALESQVWTGGMAFLDPAASGRAAGRSYLITVEQFADVVDQEMGCEVSGRAIDMDSLLSEGRLQLGDGRYETLVVAGELDGLPVVTFTSPGLMRPLNKPADAYLHMLAYGLQEAFEWSPAEAARYLSGLSGVDRSEAEIADGLYR